jgi:ParB-like chromosome segregation protein Spo0J/DNA modification methylase
MTSGTFRSVAISDITVSRDARQRTKLNDLDELAKSINTVGLINPPVVDVNLVLVAGERRLTACRDILGWTAITVQFAEDMPEDQLYLIELEENVKRSDLEWQDNVRAVAAYHTMRARTEPVWSANATAQALGMSPAEVANKRAVAAALESNDPLVCSADKYSVALGITQRQSERKRSSEIDLLQAQTARTAVGIPDDQESSPDIEPNAVPAPAKVPFLLADFSEWVQDYTGPKFNFIHCDFPYGVNAQSHNQGAAQAFGGYADSEDVYWKLLDSLAECMNTVVSESAHLMFWYSMDYHTETVDRLSAMGWKVNPFPLIWHKSDNSGILPDHRRGPRRIYETALLCSRGDRLVVQSVGNVSSHPNVKLVHMSEKNPAMLAHFFRMFVDSSTLMLDPTMGSGNAVRVSENMGAASSLGLERDPEFFARASEAYVAGNETPVIEV